MQVKLNYSVLKCPEILEVGSNDGYPTSGAQAIGWNDVTRGSPPELRSSRQPRNRGKCPIVDWLDEELNVQSFVLSGGETKAGLYFSSSEDTTGTKASVQLLNGSKRLGCAIFCTFRWG